MSTEAAAHIKKEIEALLDGFKRKRNRDKRKAFWLRMSAAILGALVTVLLGLKAGDQTEAVLKNVALVAGALVGVLNAWDAFYDHHALWVKRTQTVGRLLHLRRTCELEMELGKGSLDDATVRRFEAELSHILDDDQSSWLQLRAPRSEVVKGEAHG